MLVISESEVSTLPLDRMVGRRLGNLARPRLVQRLLRDAETRAGVRALSFAGDFLLEVTLYSCVTEVVADVIHAPALDWLASVALELATNRDLRAAIDCVAMLSNIGDGDYAYAQVVRTFVPLPAEANKTLSSAG